MARENYVQRLSRGLLRGTTRKEARGHGNTPEHPVRALSNPARYLAYIRNPVRFDRIEALAQTQEGRRRLAVFNAGRVREGKAQIEIGFPPDPIPGERQGTTDTFEEADERTQGIPSDYVRLYLSPEGITWSIRPAESRRRRRAA